ncbi:acyltransferase family protein [Vibrio sp.]|nr:acyltransferase family protein [Vibrio sp.]
MSHSISHVSRISSLDLGRVLAIIGVILIHSGAFVAYPHINGEPWIGDLINQLSRFAVPFFFITAGYFLYPKLLSSPKSTALQYCLPLLKVWLIWSVVYLALPFDFAKALEQGYFAEREGYWNYLMGNPLNTLFEGGMVHLWFLPSLVIAVAIIAGFIHKNQWALLSSLSIVLFIYGVLAGSYREHTGLESIIFTRNGPFFSTLLVFIGCYIRRANVSLNLGQSLLLMLVGLVGHLSEAFYLKDLGVSFRSHDFLFFTPVWAFGLFMCLLSQPQLVTHHRVKSIADSTMGIYLSHMLIMIYLFHFSNFLGVTGYAKTIMLVIGIFFVSLLFTKCIEKTPLKAYLIR